MKRTISTLALVAASSVACASTQVPTARVTSTEAAVQSARQAGAERVPDAQAHLATAEEELGKAKEIIRSDGDADEAEALLTRAKSDAALAAALSREAEQKARAAKPAPMPPLPTQPVEPQR